MDFKEYVTQREIIKDDAKELARLNEIVKEESLSFDEAFEVFDTIAISLEETLGLPIEVVNVKVDTLAEILMKEGIISIQELTDSVNARLMQN